jgi:pyruvate dehydrogenase E2 component (dihydrolipoamide acetyltransferase)
LNEYEERSLGMSTRQEIRVPDLGDFDDVEIVEVMVAVGDQVAMEDPLVTLETDKAAMEVPSPGAGTVAELSVATGMRVSKGDLILLLDAEAQEAPEPVEAGSTGIAASPERASAPVPAEPADTPVAPAAAAMVPGVTGSGAPASGGAASLPPINEQTFSQAHASPSVRKFARELGVDLGQVKGSGQKGRVVESDIKAFVKAILSGQGGAATGPAWPSLPTVDFAKFGEIEIKPLTRIQKISGPRLHASWVNSPHVTQNDEADITDLEKRRQKLKTAAAENNVRLTPLAFIIKACVIALKEFPVFNTSLAPDGENLVYKNYFHIGFAADTPNGLLVPVIRDADLKDVMSIAAELGELSEKARTGKLTMQEMQGGTFTVSSLGGIGGTTFTPIINAPEVAILGVGRSDFKPVLQGRKFIPRLILPLSLSYDHRVIDGATGVRFTTYLAGVLADVDRLLLGS